MESDPVSNGSFCLGLMVAAIFGIAFVCVLIAAVNWIS